LSNVVERLEASEARDLSVVSFLLEDEYSKSPLARTGKFSPECSVDDRVVTVRIMRGNGRPLAVLEFK
jgi:hypothetical protein